jgi:hypothetical protein
MNTKRHNKSEDRSVAPGPVLDGHKSLGERMSNAIIADSDEIVLTHVDAPAWAAKREQHDDHIRYGLESMIKPVCAEQREEVTVHMDSNDRLILDNDRPAIARDSEPWIVIGDECSYKWTPAQARVLAAALVQLADAADA